MEETGLSSENYAENFVSAYVFMEVCSTFISACLSFHFAPLL